MTNSTLVSATITGPSIIEDTVVYEPRPFNHETDVRKFTFQEAVEAAERRAAETSIRQRVFTLPVPDADAHIRPRFLVQAI